MYYKPYHNVVKYICNLPNHTLRNNINHIFSTNTPKKAREIMINTLLKQITQKDITTLPIELLLLLVPS